jgi:hypothetical protein
MKDAFGVIGVIVLVVAVVCLIMGIPTMLLWGYLMPTLFPGAVAAGTVVAKITFWQAVWLNVFTSILFKSTSVKSSS